MTTPTLPELYAELCALRATTDATLAAQERDLATLRAALAARRVVRAATTRHPTGRWRALPALALLLLMALLPMGLLAANPFRDLNAGSVHNANIDAIFSAGITKGCDPGVAFCPNGLVTREEMASFLARTAGLGDNPPVANAKTAQSAATAGNATTVQGHQANALVRVASASNNTVGEINSTAPNFTQTVAVNITTPGPGFVLVNGAVNVAITDLACDGGDVGATCTVTARLRDTASGGLASPGLVTVVTNDNNTGALSPVFLFSAGAAGSHTYMLEVTANDKSTGRVEFSAPTITAVYVPFGPNGQEP